MTVISVYSVPRRGFLLAESLEAHPDLQITLESVIPAGEEVVPYLWVFGGNDDAMDALRTDRSVADVTTLDRTERGRLLKVRWRGTDDALLSEVASSRGSIIEGIIEDDDWRLRIRFPDRDALAAFDRNCRRSGIETELVSLHHPGTDAEEGRLLTPTQHETLRLALALGYFEVPREATLDEIALELDVSDTAVSQRLRRGVKRLVEAAVATD
ncbi:helix-turn-helix domain-containing protein [Halorientalis salina]|uniref:helix-turn-helix domain-containing protein n=1 Tax=Halorientalis salina TaxID=2932266 RepID=UPI0010AC4114|nr:bacterio-opsin activator domain-containing protein [Halorientalis salina]